MSQYGNVGPHVIAICEAVKSEIITRYAWASDAAKLDSYIGGVMLAVAQGTNGYRLDTPAMQAALKSLGIRPTYKAIREYVSATPHYSNWSGLPK